MTKFNVSYKQYLNLNRKLFIITRQKNGIESILYLTVLLIFSTIFQSNSQVPEAGGQKSKSYFIPEEYLREPDEIPVFWINTVDEVNNFLKQTVRKGKLEIIGTSAGGRPIYAVFYGHPRQGTGTTTFSGALGFRDVRAYRGPDHEKTVYLGMAAVHGGEFEGIVGMVNLISVLETGKDLRGEAWPEIPVIAEMIDRMILIPIMNPDGRDRIPIRMEAYQGTNPKVHEFLNTGGRPDGTPIGWPQIKEFIPWHDSIGFPGGYTNDAGVNIMHDDFFGKLQPETQILFDLAEREKPDLIINMHTGGASHMFSIYPFTENIMQSVFESYFTFVHTVLTQNGLQRSYDIEREADPKRLPKGTFNLDSALNMHCGALSICVESPPHGYTVSHSGGILSIMTPDMLLDTQLLSHQESMRFLVETGGRSKWTPGLGK